MFMEHALKTYRTANRISAQQLAETVGTTRQTIHRIEAFKVSPSLELVGRIVRATGGEIRADDFLPRFEVAGEAA